MTSARRCLRGRTSLLAPVVFLVRATGRRYGGVYGELHVAARSLMNAGLGETGSGNVSDSLVGRGRQMFLTCLDFWVVEIGI